MAHPSLPVSRVIHDPKRVKRIQDRGEAIHRRLTRKTCHDRTPIRDIPSPPREELETNIANQFHAIKTQYNKFIPHANFDQVITPETVLQLVKTLPCYAAMAGAHMQIAQDIYYGKAGDASHPPCRKLIAAMIIADDDLDMLKTYIDQKMSDSCLPLQMDAGSGRLACHDHGAGHRALNRQRRRPGKFCDDFMEASKQLMVPFIVWNERDLHHHYVMEGGGRLPMIFESGSMKGGFGEVSKVKILPGDGRFGRHQTPDGYFALKRLMKSGSTEFDLEVSSLIFAESRANRVPDPDDNETKNHLIKLLATFEIYDSTSRETTYYLLFPWADGNLNEFWKTLRPKHSARNKEDLGWMVEQFMRLGKALQCIHNDREHILSGRTDSNRFGRHGDIKPGNFLYFSHGSGPDGKNPTLVLADFGLGRLHSRETRSQDSPRENPATVTYQAPEYEIEGAKLSPKSDIFSLGCVFLEYITWLLYDDEAIASFGKARAGSNAFGWETDVFFTISPSGTSATIKKGVRDWIQNLQSHPDCVEVVGDMLDLIHKEMLEPNQGRRINSQTLVNRLEKISKCWKRADSLYGTRLWKESSRHLGGDRSYAFELYQ